MRKAKLIKGLITEDITVDKYGYPYYFSDTKANCSILDYENSPTVEEHINTVVLPLHSFYRWHQEDWKDLGKDPYSCDIKVVEETHILYSPEVEKLIGVPVNRYISKIQEIESGMYKLERLLAKREKEVELYKDLCKCHLNMGFWSRLKFLFKGGK